MNIQSKIKNVFFLIVVSITLLSCEYNVEEETIIDSGGDGGEEIESCDPDISFTSSIKVIIDNNCIGCHGGSRFPDLRTYQGIKNSATAVQNQVVTRRMPQGGSLSNSQIELIRCWIENGALDN